MFFSHCEVKCSETKRNNEKKEHPNENLINFEKLKTKNYATSLPSECRNKCTHSQAN
jgi:hypothetical protein